MRNNLLMIGIACLVILLLLANGYLYFRNDHLKSSNAALLAEYFKATDYCILTVEPALHNLVKGDAAGQLKSIAYINKGMHYLEYTRDFMGYAQSRYYGHGFNELPYEGRLAEFSEAMRECANFAFEQLQAGQALSGDEIGKAELCLRRAGSVAAATDEILNRYSPLDLYKEINSQNTELFNLLDSLFSAFGGGHEK